MTDLREHFLLRPDITFLNFGSFGACVKPVFERYQQYQLELEQEPVEFITVTGPRYLAESRRALGAFLNADADDLVYVTNPSYAVNLVAKSLALKPGDEILGTNLEYGACDRTWDFYCEKAGARYVRQPISLPLTDTDSFVRQLFNGRTARTRLIFLSHITSSTALRFPVEEVCARARQEGIPVFVDGAHGPAQVPVNLREMDPDYYTGACHKWMMTPKGSSFLYTRKDRQQDLEPLIVSWGYRALFPSASQYLDHHQFNGTRDFSAFLTIPDAIRFMEQQNWTEVSRRCREQVRTHAREFFSVTGGAPLAPLDDRFSGQMLSAEISCREPEKLHDYLLEKYRIQVPVMRHGEKVYLRYSIQAFNEAADLEKLFASLQEIRRQTNLLG